MQKPLNWRVFDRVSGTCTQLHASRKLCPSENGLGDEFTMSQVEFKWNLSGFHKGQEHH